MTKIPITQIFKNLEFENSVIGIYLEFGAYSEGVEDGLRRMVEED